MMIVGDMGLDDITVTFRPVTRRTELETITINAIMRRMIIVVKHNFKPFTHLFSVIESGKSWKVSRSDLNWCIRVRF
jgi:hypothetical protein